MNIQELQKLYARLPQVTALAKMLEKNRDKRIFLEGLLASSGPMMFSSLSLKTQKNIVFVLQDAEEAGYFYHDLCQIIGESGEIIGESGERRVESGERIEESGKRRGESGANTRVLFFPSSFRRSIKYGQKDPASEILRTEVLTKLSFITENGELRTERYDYTLRKQAGEETLRKQASEETLRKQASEETLRKEASEKSNHTSQFSVLSSQLYIVSYPEAIAEKVVTRKNLDSRTLNLAQGQTDNVDAICEKLREFGFREVDYVYEPGQFALRGSILDVFSFSHEFPYRIDFFGDEIDSIRTFEVENQLSKERQERISIVPEMAGVEEKESLLKFLPADTILAFRNYAFVRDAIERTYQEGFSAQAIQERMEGATEMEQKEIERELQRDGQIITGSQFAADAEPFVRIEMSRQHDEKAAATIRFNTSIQPLFHKNFELLSQTLEDYRLKGYQIYILADSQKQNERLKEILQSDNGERRTVRYDYRQGEITNSKSNHTSHLSPLTSQPFNAVEKTLHEGFVDHDLRVCFFTDHQIFDRFHKYNLKSDKARSGKVALTLKEIQQFEIGDYVVHVDHGIGKFGGLVRMPMTTPDGKQSFQEMIKIIYQRGDSIYVSIHSLYKVSKYKSQEGGDAPRMSTLGTGQWERLKERTKKQIKDIARDLIKLYATRRKQRGFAFSHDTYLQQALEASFLYEDTPDQLKATQDVKADMESPRPMDRLVCGDVGFGKTEVAVRAAFKAAVDGKQVAVLVPTTVLAYQHFRTFSSRLKDMPVRVDYLSRARSAKQTKEVLADLADGKVDILIGTHKLIGKTVKFKDLGLLIIDEEQKFGVSTKEKLRQMKTNVDTLTMSATPIPRTLQFSLVGARDLSTIQTPPPNRYPIQTEIHTFGAEIIADAINFEMSRNGQVYFVNNRISDLTHIAEMIKKYVPDCRIAIGHGQMKPDELEQIVLDFSNYDYDVLLSTTIVENGIDIPNANTIIINGAHYFGLSDLHQMRGRVGRGNRKAFCYLLAPPLSALPVDARRRLEALESFSDLGSGINIAMQDLDIRGAGNLLGCEQSGFISDLGYETYQKILNEAMVELRNETESGELKTERYDYHQGEKTNSKSNHTSPFSPLRSQLEYVSDCTLESDLEMYFPDTYVPNDSERMLLYRELDSIRDDKGLEAYRTRLKDRFGDIPHVAEELLQVVPLRRYGKMFGCEQIMLKQGRMFLFFVSNPNSPFYQSEAFGRVLDFVAQNARRCTFRDQQGKRSLVLSDVPTVEEAVRVMKSMNNEQ